MVGAGENHAFDAVASGRFINMENPGDIGPEDFFERALNRDSAEMQDGIYAFNQLVNSVFVGEIAQLYFFAGVDSGCHRGDIRQS